VANALASPRKKSPRPTKPAPINIKGRPGGGYLQWVTVPRASKPDLNLQVRWGLYGLPIGVVVYPPNKLYLGKIVVAKRTAPESPKTKRPRCTFVDSAYELERQAGHITTGYAEEVDALHTAQKIARDANRVTLTTGDAKKLEGYQATMAHLLTAFEAQINERVRDQDKVNARQQMAASVTLTDTTGRPNPRAMAARTQAAVTRLTRRTMGAAGISARILKRRIIAESLIDFAAQFVFIPAISLATMLTSEFQNLEFSQGHRDSLIARCTDIARLCRLIDWRPHVHVANKLVAELDDAMKMLHQNNMDMVLAHFTVIREICDLYVVQLQLHEIITEYRNSSLLTRAMRIDLLATQVGLMASKVDVLSSVVLSRADREQVLKYLNAVFEQLCTIRPPIRLRASLKDKQHKAVARDLREAGRLL